LKWACLILAKGHGSEVFSRRILRNELLANGGSVGGEGVAASWPVRDSAILAPVELY